MRKLRVLLLSAVSLCVISATAQSKDILANIQNDAVSNYLNSVVYTSQDDTSLVADFLVPNNVRLDVPKPAIVEVPDYFKDFIDAGILSVRYCFDNSFAPEVTDTVPVPIGEPGAAIYDVQPGVECFYKTYLYNMMIGWGKLTTEGPVRMINLSSVRNVRDLGGWTTSDGRTIKYGKLIRGGELNGEHIADAADIQHLLDLGVAAEIDLRSYYEVDHGVSAFGFKDAVEVATDEVPTFLYANDSGQLLSHLTMNKYLQHWREQFEFIVDNLSEGRTIFFHCRWGANRTGYLALLLEGLLGVTYDGLIKDYELTSFANLNEKKENIDPVINFIQQLDGETLQEKFNTFWKERVKVKQEDIDYFIDEMLDGEKPGGDVVTSIADVKESSVSTTYDLQGRRVSANRRGLIIQRQQDGSVRKIVKSY